jgi:hypothetical protein
MTEAEWLACTDPMPMLEFLRDKTSDRKLRLLECGTCRLYRQLLTVENATKAMEKIEQLIDASATKEQIALGWKGLWDAGWGNSTSIADVDLAARTAKEWSAICGYPDTGRPQQSRLVYCIFGNPFRPLIFDSTWLTSNVVGLARAIYDERVFDRMPILGDALEDAGCDNQDILNHCRQGGEHVRGCWVVDLVLGKE